MALTKTCDPYLVKRAVITGNIDNSYLLEVDGLCPLCGRFVLLPKGKRMNKQYDIAHIYPNSPTPSEEKELRGLERLGTNCEDFENKIVLCKGCHRNYDDNKTKDEYLNLLAIKKRLISVSKAKTAVSHQDLQKEIVLLINALSRVDGITLEKMKFKYKALKVSKKVEDRYTILKNKIENNVCIYFNFIRETFQNLDQAGQINFKLVASQVKTGFLQCENNKLSKSEVFDSLVKWLKSRSIYSSTEACEAVVSYFVQNCEVFHEITE